MAKAIKYSVEIFLQSKNMMEVSDFMKDTLKGYVGSGMGFEGRDVQWIMPTRASALELAGHLMAIAEKNQCKYHVTIRPTKNY